MPSLLSPSGRALLWRVHGLAALLASPLLLIAVITGLIYLPTPQVEAWQLRQLPAAGAGPRLPLDRLLDAGRAAAPAGLQLQQVLTPAAAGDALRLRFVDAAPAGTHHAPQGALWLFLDPASGVELGRQPEAERYGVWAAQLHAQLRQGEAWRWLVELAATALLLMLLSGLLLALPLRGRGLRRWHALGGLLLAALTAAITLTGLTWSERAGAQIRALRDAAGWAPPRPPTDLRAIGAGHAETVWRTAQAERPGRRLLLSPPRQPEGLWRVSLGERDQPWQRLELLVDASDGRVHWRSEWADLSGFARLTAVGIPFHRGELGLWNQALLALFALGLLGALLSGLLMLRRRLHQGGRLWVRSAQPAPGRWVAALLLLAASALFPLLLILLVLLLLAEWRPAFRTPRSVA